MSNRLPETDLANWSFLPASQKRLAIEAFERPKLIMGSYEPFRRVFPDAVNKQLPLFSEGLARSEWSQIEKGLLQECKGKDSLVRMNMAIASATHRYAQDLEIAASGLDVRPLRFAGSMDYRFGLNLLVRYKDRASIVFLDMRKSKGLNPSGRLFVFSALHHRFREGYPDLEGVDLEIWYYRNNKDRDLVPISNKSSLYSWDELVADVFETHRIWEDVRRGGEDRKRAGGGGMGPLFD